MEQLKSPEMIVSANLRLLGILSGMTDDSLKSMLETVRCGAKDPVRAGVVKGGRRLVNQTGIWAKSLSDSNASRSTGERKKKRNTKTRDTSTKIPSTPLPEMGVAACNKQDWPRLPARMPIERPKTPDAPRPAQKAGSSSTAARPGPNAVEPYARVSLAHERKNDISAPKIPRIPPIVLRQREMWSVLLQHLKVLIIRFREAKT